MWVNIYLYVIAFKKSFLTKMHFVFSQIDGEYYLSESVKKKYHLLSEKKKSFLETVSGSGAEAVQTEGGSSSASEETLFRHQRRRATVGSTESGFPGHLQQSQPAELPCRPAVSLFIN